jgi:hypothetical protein
MYSASKKNALHRINLNSINLLTFAASPRDMLPDTHRFTRARELLGQLRWLERLNVMKVIAIEPSEVLWERIVLSDRLIGAASGASFFSENSPARRRRP